MPDISPEERRENANDLPQEAVFPARKTVHSDRLKELGFTQDLIHDAEEYAASGLLEIEPAAETCLSERSKP